MSLKPSLILFFLLLTFFCFPRSEPPFKVTFYNVENLFDPENNPDKDDDDFTPEGKRKWNNYRYYNKIKNLGKVISNTGEWDIPALVGLCEIENEKVLKDLARHSPLMKFEYRYVLTDSDDVRGMNVALLYQRDRFKYIEHQEIQPLLSNNSKKTRNILYVTGMIITGDTLDVFICHYPSRREGQKETEKDRIQVSNALRATIDSLFSVRKYPQILIMGDFNDEPKDKSIYQILGAKEISDISEADHLYNLFYSISKESKIGSYKYKEDWNFLDQILVSGNLLNQESPFRIKPDSPRIYQADYILTEDITQGGLRPLKTYHGYRHEGGFSDHLPVCVGFEFIIPEF